MPSIIPSYIYTLFASLIVSTLIIGMCGIVTSNIKLEAEKQQLSNIVDYVTAKSVEVASNALAYNISSTVSLDIPNLIGNKVYWIRITDDGERAFVEGGFGAAIHQSRLEVEIPLEVSASGAHISTSNLAFLSCHVTDQSIQLELKGDK